MDHDFDNHHFLTIEDEKFVLSITFWDEDWVMGNRNTLKLYFNENGEIVEEKRIGDFSFNGATLDETYEDVKETYEKIIKMYQKTLKRFYPLFILKDIPEIRIVNAKTRGKIYQIYFHLDDSDLLFEFFSNFNYENKQILNLFFYPDESGTNDANSQFLTEFLNWELRKKLFDYFLNKSSHRIRLLFLEQQRKSIKETP